MRGADVTKYLALYGLTAVVFFAIDFVWLTLATSRIYEPYIGDLLLERPNLPVAAAFYLLYVIGVLVLASIPGYDKASLADAIMRGALLGLLAYGTYDLTNLATLKGWAWQVSAIDMVWGMTLTGTVAAAGYAFARWLQV
jgi:uncharacterized membrane protein